MLVGGLSQPPHNTSVPVQLSKHLPQWRLLLALAVGGLAFEFVAFLDTDGARADDLDLLVVGSGGASPSIPPPNILFLFDTSKTMNNLMCANLPAGQTCDQASLTGHVATGSSSICTSPALQAAVGPDLNSDNTLDPYDAPWDSTATIFEGTHYPVFANIQNVNYFNRRSVYSQAVDNPFVKAYAAGMTETLANVIARACDMLDCEKKSRCIFSLRTQGYFWEPTGSTCGTGDPMGICASAEVCGNGSCGGAENGCNCPSDCGAGSCGDGICCPSAGESSSTCTSDCSLSTCGNGSCDAGEDSCLCPGDCGASSCGDTVCCSSAGESTATCATDCPPAAGTLGAACSSGTDCNSGFCKSNVCSTCGGNGDCAGSSKCINTGCIHSYCDTDTCNPGGGGGGGGLGGGGSLTAAVSLATSEVSAIAVPANKDGPYYLGDFLNFYPPKGIALKQAFVSSLGALTGDVRMGVIELDGTGHDIKPPCSQSSGPDCFDGDAATDCFGPAMSQLINDVNQLDFDLADKPLATALDNAGDMFTSNTGVSTPICDYSSITTCTSNNYIVLVSDGLPSGDAASWTDLSFVSGYDTGISGDGDGVAGANGSLLDEVAKALVKIDHRSDITDDQVVGTYTVSYGLTDPSDSNRCVGLLEGTAVQGTGRCLPATNVVELQKVLTTIINEIIQRARGFTAPSVPTTRFSGTSNLSNAVFRPSTNFPLWEGHIFGLKICDEQLGRESGTPCTCTADNIDEVCVQDELDNPVSYDDQGYLDSKPFWDAALCLAGDVGNLYDAQNPKVPMDPHSLDVSTCYRSASTRVIKTAVPDPSDLSAPLQLIDFTAANVSVGSKLLSALDVAGDVSAGQQLVNFYRGFDAFDADGDGNTSEDRNIDTIKSGDGSVMDGWWKLGDVFHSIPNVVERPNGYTVGSWAKTESYKAFTADNENRKKVVLVGANDGMLHAFHSGTWDSSLNGGSGGYDAGTGTELWAFVTPEMLGQLKGVCDPSGGGCDLSKHRWMVDGSVMVRDVWTGGDRDKNVAANKAYWRTVAVFGHRDGGNSYVALDVTDVENPTFLWRFPKPASVDPDGWENKMGKSWLDTFPAPASIGPLRWDDDDDVSTPFIDKWVVLLSGGFDRLDNHGKFLVMLDIATGNVVWSAEKVLGTSTEKMDYSFPATPVFYGDLSGTYPYIAGIVAADHGGQLWHIPTPAQAQTAGKFTFEPELFFTAVEPSDRVVSDGDNVLDAAEYQRFPFFFAPTLTRNKGKVRVIIGTGDRDMLIPPASIDSTIEGYICDDRQRIYALDVIRCPSGGGTRPCTTSDLQLVDPAADQYATDQQIGWYYELDPGEKSATPYEIFQGFGYYSTFAPTVACGAATANVCTPDAKGEARLYARHYLTGKLNDWDRDGVDVVADAYKALGSGVPTAPAISVGVSASGATPTVLAGGSDTGLTAAKAGDTQAGLIVELMRFSVSREMHDILHQP